MPSVAADVPSVACTVEGGQRTSCIKSNGGYNFKLAVPICIPRENGVGPAGRAPANAPFFFVTPNKVRPGVAYRIIVENPGAPSPPYDVTVDYRQSASYAAFWRGQATICSD